MRLTASFLVGLALGGRVYFYFLPRVERSVLRLHFCQEGLWLSIRWRSTFRGSKYEGSPIVPGIGSNGSYSVQPYALKI